MTLYDAILRFVPEGHRDEYGVWHDGPLRHDALAELVSLHALETAVREGIDGGYFAEPVARTLQAHVAALDSTRSAVTAREKWQSGVERATDRLAHDLDKIYDVLP